MINSTEFGDGRWVRGHSTAVIVVTKEHSNAPQLNSVEICWSCCGSVDIAMASEFYTALGEALAFARGEVARVKE